MRARTPAPEQHRLIGSGRLSLLAAAHPAATRARDALDSARGGMMSTKSPGDVLAIAKERGVQIVDLRFDDLLGTWQHSSLPARELVLDLFDEGIGFDGSSIRGFQEIHESDMLLIADATTAFVDPILQVPTLSVICDIFDPITRQPYSRDPRYV